MFYMVQIILPVCHVKLHYTCLVNGDIQRYFNQNSEAVFGTYFDKFKLIITQYHFAS